MENEKKMSIEAKMIQRFSNINDICNSAIDYFQKADKGEVEKGRYNVFDMTEKIKIEIEEIRDLLFQ